MYPLQKMTRYHHIPFYVNRDFDRWINNDESKYQNYERGVENEYVRGLQSQCAFQRQRKAEMVRKANGIWGFGKDEELLKQANEMKMEACETLSQWSSIGSSG